MNEIKVKGKIIPVPEKLLDQWEKKLKEILMELRKL